MSVSFENVEKYKTEAEEIKSFLFVIYKSIPLKVCKFHK